MGLQVCFSAMAIASLMVFASAHSESVQSVKFGYSGALGPGKWGRLNPSFKTCSSGKIQSPININRNQTVQNKDLDALTRDYKPVNATLVNNGFNVMVHFESDCGGLSLQGVKYSLKQMHWHSPSEHWIDGVQYPAELHLVHESEAGALSVISILFEYGDADPLISKLQSNLDMLAKEACAGDEDALIPLGIMHTKLLRKNTRKYFRYIGSLTTPPCTENVIWNILGKVRTISKEQVAALKAPLGDACKNNARPPQPLNGRKIELYSELD